MSFTVSRGSEGNPTIARVLRGGGSAVLALGVAGWHGAPAHAGDTADETAANADAAAVAAVATAPDTAAAPETDAAADAASALRFETLAPGVFAALQPPSDRFDDCNSLVILGPRGVLVVDAQSDADSTRRVIAEIRARTDQPVRFVVNTHWHGDHTQGNALYVEAFGPAVAFVGHESLTRDVPDRAAAALVERVERLERAVAEAEVQLAEGKSRGGVELDADGRARQAQAIAETKVWVDANRNTRFIAPAITYRDGLTLWLGDREVRLMHFRAHTRGDTVVWLPGDRILATGDVLDDMPYVGHGYPSPWIDALETLRTLDFAMAVPGHGPVFRGPKKLYAEIAFLRALVERTRQAVDAGLTLEAAVDGVGLADQRAALAGDDPIAQRFFDGTVGEAIERAWREARGEITD